MSRRQKRNAKTWAGLGVLALALASLGARAEAPSQLTGKVWMQDGAAAAPGSMWIFLEDGTLVMGSCTEPYRLAQWRHKKEGMLVISEGETQTPTLIVSLTDDTLRLRVSLVDDTKLERSYRHQTAPFTCPAAADPEKIAARGQNGVLEITIAKRAERQPRRIHVAS